ncbi:Pseudouridine-5'-phosphate glycosidase [bioreactor metagenome]|uniref:Pseudouridine-5'-phosphate glycosidase n=1 Tax=bioreactor metagenome TaxID=1076179 RepID=A0A645I0R1_9ZZZZ
MTNVAVVCAGAKSILDIGLTLEYLETKGVPVVGFNTDELPAFYTRKSGFKVDYRVDTEANLAKALKAKWDLGLNGGVVVANPIPEKYAMDFDVITNAITNAVKEAEEKGIKGKESTPFLLSKVKEITKGESLESNIQLVFNNAVVGARLAVELSKLS